MAYQDAITALADPTRRSLVEALRSGPTPVGVLAQAVPVSRPAVSQHLKVLTDAGLVRMDARGTRRFYRLEPRGLAGLRAYLDALWDDALARFADRAVAISKQTPMEDER